MGKDVAKTSSKFIKDKVKQALDKAAEAMDPSQQLFKEEGWMQDDLAVTSMARIWHGHGGGDNSAPIKVGKASPVEGTLPSAVTTPQDPFQSAWSWEPRREWRASRRSLERDSSLSGTTARNC